jgi:hypothetical protein
MSHNVKKKELSVAALSLCYPINEDMPWFRRQFAGAGCARQREKACETGHSLLGPYLSEKKITLKSGKLAFNIFPSIYRKYFATFHLSF